MIVQNETQEDLEGNGGTCYSMCPFKLASVPAFKATF